MEESPPEQISLIRLSLLILLIKSNTRGVAQEQNKDSFLSSMPSITNRTLLSMSSQLDYCPI